MDKDSVSIVVNIKTMTPTYSIIIPHKGIPDLLMRCLRSIPVSDCRDPIWNLSGRKQEEGLAMPGM